MFKLFFYIILSLFIISCGESGDLENAESNDLSANVNSILTIEKQKKSIDINLTQGSLNKEYVYNLKSTNQIDAKKFYIYEGDLPKGLELNEETGVISGTPQKSGDFKLKIAIKYEEDKELVIIPANISIDDNINFYKDVRSFIDISKSNKSTTINHNGLIDFNNKVFFKFYNEGITKLRVCQQGYLKLGGDNCAISSDFQGDKIIAPFADPDLVIGPDSKIHYQIRGEAPRRMLIVQFKNLNRITDSKASQNFEVIIYEDTARITFLYALSYPGSDTTQKHLGTNAIIGLSLSQIKNKIIAPETPTTTPKPQIFNGTVITFSYNQSSNQYSQVLDSNVVTDFVDISRYLEETDDCTADSQCITTNKCFQGKCAAQLLTNSLMYDNAKSVKLPFSFNFYGGFFNEVNVHENGYLFFGATNYAFYPTVPELGSSKPVLSMDLDYVIAGLYSNIELKSARGGNILYNVIGSSPNRKAVFLYDKVRIIDDNTSETHICTFEMVLHETSNVIEFLYGTNNKSDFCSGKVSSVGLKKDNADYASIISNNQVLKQGKSIVFVPNDAMATSYTWSGVGNEIKNSVLSDGVTGKFTQVASQWQSIDDQSSQTQKYTKTIVPNRWIPSSTASSLRLGWDGYMTLGYVDQNSQPITFNVYGKPRSVFYIHENGGIAFENDFLTPNEPGDLKYTNGAMLPDTGIFPLWNNLYQVSNVGETRYGVYTRQGSPEYILMIEWNNVSRLYIRNNSWKYNGHYTFQVQLHQSGQMYFCYKEIDDVSWLAYNTSYLSGVRSDINNNLENADNLSDLAATGNCISYTPTTTTDPNHIVGTRSTVTDQDGGEQNIPLGFSYDFQGTSYDNLTISSNGIAVFENATTNISATNLPLSSTSVDAYDNSLALFWDNLNPRLNTDPGSGVFYKTIGTSPNRTFLLSYNSVPHGSDASSKINAQLVLKEGNSSILYCYGYLGGSFSSGDSATVGVRKTSSEYTELLYKQNLLSSNTCYIWTPPTPGLSEARNIYTGESNSDFIDLPVENPDTLNDGDYLDPLYLDSNDNISKPYKIYDLEAQNYNFVFKGKEYKQLFVDANGAVSFGNDNDAAIVTGPLWGDVFYQEDITNKSHISLQSQYENVENDFMWIANAGANSLSKINTHTGVKIGEWPVGTSPSRTAVGFDGSVWVGNRGSHDVTKLDRDGNFVCTVKLHDNCKPRGLALDKDENLWVGCCSSENIASHHRGYVYKMKHNRTSSGNTCELIDLDPSTSNNTAAGYAYKGHDGQCIYGLAIDKQGVLWSSGIGAKILRIDTNKTTNEPGFYQRFNTPAGLSTYGIAIDQEGSIWHARWLGDNVSTTGVIKSVYNNGTLTSTVFPSLNSSDVRSGRGVAVDALGNVWVAYSYAGNGKVGKYAPDGTALGLFNINTNTKLLDGSGGDLCKRPIGVGVDGDGDVWVNCQSNGHSEELDANSGEELSNFYTGNSPYCYSDNTGFNLRNIVSDIKPAKYYAKVVEKIEEDNSGNKICDRVLAVEWRDVRIKTDDNYGYTESTFEMMFDNGYRYDIDSSNGREVCDTSKTPVATPNITIKYLYGALQGNKFSQKTGGQSTITMKSLYSTYNHMFGDNDSGTVNSGSKLIITSEK